MGKHPQASVGLDSVDVGEWRDGVGWGSVTAVESYLVLGV